MEDTVELRWVFWVIRRWLWLIVGCVLLTATSAFVVSSRMPPVYSASATLLVHVAPGTGMSDYTAIRASELLAGTYSQMLRGRPVMEAVIARLELEETPGALVPGRRGRTLSVPRARGSTTFIGTIQGPP